MARVKSRGSEFRGGAEVEAAIDKGAAWLYEGRKNSLLLTGNIGAGKTTLALSLCNVIDTFNSYSSCFRCVKATAVVNAARDEEEGRFDHIKMAKRLFIDDLGIEPAMSKVYGNETTPIVDLLYFRYDRMLPTIIATNLSIGEIRDKYGDRVFDRIRETFAVMQFNGESMRG